MACISRALIIGGGIAGLSAAIALSRIGVKCDVVELHGVPLGACLGISGRAAEALDALGVYEECRASSRAFTPDSTVLHQWDAAGNLITPGPKSVNWPGAKTAIGVYRPNFLQILADAAIRHGADIQVGITVESLHEEEETTRALFTNGDARHYDLVIGADGINSATRKMAFSEAKTPIYAGQMSIRWMAPGPFLEGEGWYHGDVGRLGFYHIPQGMIYVPSVITMPEPTRLSNAEIFALFSRLLDSYSADAVVELRRRLTPDADLICNSYHWTLLPDPWYKGRTLLIGDAAHATTSHMGMGGGMALEDSVVLAQSISAANSLAEALAAFMARRFARVRTVVEASVAASKLEQANASPVEKFALIGGAMKIISQPY